MNLHDASQNADPKYEKILKTFGTKLPNVSISLCVFIICGLQYV